MSGSVFIESASYSVPEQNGVVSVTFKRTGDTSLPVNLTYDINPFTADADLDYSGDGAVVQFAAGQTTLRVDIPIVDDALSEPTEVFNVSIVSLDSGTLLFPRTTNVRILDNETPTVEPADPPLESDYDVELTDVVTGLERPINIEWLPGSDSQAIVVQQTGSLVLVDTQSGERLSTLLSIPGEVNANADRGLMDIALHPDFDANPFLYAFYVVEPEGSADGVDGQRPDAAGNRFAHVVKYEVNTDGPLPTLVEGSKEILLGAAGQTFADISGEGRLNFTEAQFADNLSSEIDPETGDFKNDYIKLDSQSHAGGALAFGPDGNLYVSIGDGTSFNYADPRSADVQNLDSLSGKILRVDPLTGQGLADNPFAEPGADLDANRSKVYQLGLRNPYTMTFTDDGDLFLSETGWFTYEEINSGPPGANFGWPYYEGGDNGELLPAPGYSQSAEARAFYAAVEAGEIEITPPYRAFSREESDPGFQFNAIVGSSSVYNGDKYPAEFLNDYFFTDIPQGEIFAVDTNDRTEIKYVTNLDPFGPTNFVQGPDGFIYLMDVSGSVKRLEITDPNAPTNQAPVLDVPLDEQSAVAGGSIAFQVPSAAFADPDGDALSLSAQLEDGGPLPSWLTFDPASGQFSGTPSIANIGKTVIRVTAIDPSGETASDVFSLNIGGANVRPVVESALASQTGVAGSELVFTVPADTFSDANGDALVLSATRSDGSALPAWLSFDPATGLFSGIPAEANVGRVVVTVTATDPSGASTSDSFLVDIQSSGTENADPIVIAPLSDVVVAEEQVVDFTVPADAFTDPDGDALALTATLSSGAALPAWLSFDPATGRFSGIPDDPQVGTISVAVTARDSSGGTATDVFNLQVTPVNDAPTLASPLGDQAATTGAAFTFLVSASTFADADDAVLVLSATGQGGADLPAWLNFDETTGTFSGTPGESDLGAIEVVVTARDAGGLDAQSTFTVSVTESTDPTDETVINDIASANQILTGTSDNDVFAFDGPSSRYNFGETADGQGTVIWTVDEGDDTFDILFGFQTIRFTDREISLSDVVNTGPNVNDDPLINQFVTGEGDADRFVIDGPSSDYLFGPTEAGDGVVIWTADPADSGFDIVYDFEQLAFSDVTFDISAVPSGGDAVIIPSSAGSATGAQQAPPAEDAPRTVVVDAEVLGSAANALIDDFSTLDGDRLDLGALLDANFSEATKDNYVRAVTADGNTRVQVDGDGLANGNRFEDVATLQGVTGGSITVVDDATLVEIAVQNT